MDTPLFKMLSRKAQELKIPQTEVDECEDSVDLIRLIAKHLK